LNNIRYKGVRLLKLNFILNPPGEIKSTCNVSVKFNVENRLDKENRRLTTILTGNLKTQTEPEVFVLEVSIEGIFEGDNPEDLEKFSQVHAPAHLFPFMREIIANTTMRAGIPPVLLPPVNFMEKKL
jgi:preprotein translocase subunit SecB